jgi:hypothetical protein
MAYTYFLKDWVQGETRSPKSKHYWGRNLEFGDRVMREYGAKYGAVCHHTSGCDSGIRQHN